MPDKCKTCSHVGNAAISETDTSRTSTASTTKSAIRRRRKLRLLVSMERLDGGITESHGETRRQHLHLHLQLRSGRLRNGKKVGVHGEPTLHLRNGGDFGFLERGPENSTGSVRQVHP